VPLVVELTAQQAADPELVGEIRQVLEDTGLAPERLRPGFPAAVLPPDAVDAADNLKVLSEIGVAAEIHGFGAAGDITSLVDLPVHTVRLAGNLVARRDHPLVERSTTALVEAAHAAGVAVSVAGVADREQAAWWRQRGVDVVSGAVSTELPGGLPGS
jgi:EAL domain-containing protein (putative c-di-GMP-specific phosphodiesterase class I)